MIHEQDKDCTKIVRQFKMPRKRGINRMDGNWARKKQRGYYLSNQGVELLDKICKANGISASSAIEMIIADYYFQHREKIECLLSINEPGLRKPKYPQ